MGVYWLLVQPSLDGNLCNKGYYVHKSYTVRYGLYTNGGNF